MKVLQLIPHYRPAFQYGGPIYSVHNLAKGLVEQGVDVEVWTTNLGIKGRVDVPLGEKVVIDGVKVYYFPIIGNFHYAFSPSMLRYLKKNILKFDIIHIQGIYQFHSLIGGYYSRKFGIPYVISPRGMLLPYFVRRKSRLKKSIYINLITRRNIKGASLVHFTTKKELKQLNKLRFNLRNTTVIPNPVSSTKTISIKGNFFRKQYNLEKKIIILFMGRLVWSKGLDLLTPSFTKVVKAHPEVHLVLAGASKANFRNKVEKWIEDRNIKSSVTITGHLDSEEKRKILKESDVFIQPSYSESFGMSSAEAMLYGLPIIVSEKVGISELVWEEKCGEVVKLTVDNISEGIVRLLENPGKRKKMGKKAQEIAKREFSIQRVAKKMIEAYKRVL